MISRQMVVEMVGNWLCLVRSWRVVIFDADNPENQQDLGSQQQTFRANQPVPRPGLANGTSPLLGNEQE